MICPNCKSNIAWDRRAARPGFFCGQCGSEVRASEGYARTLLLISLLVGFGLVWVPVFQGHGGAFLQSCLGFVALLALALPLAGVVLFFLVRLVPIVISPPLVIQRSGPVYGLGLTGWRDEEAVKSERNSAEERLPSEEPRDRRNVCEAPKKGNDDCADSGDPGQATQLPISSHAELRCSG